MITREELGHHLEACLVARFPQEGMGQGRPNPQEFITKTTQELQDARAMRRDRRSRGAVPHPGEDAGLRVCIDVPGLNRATQLRSHALRLAERGVSLSAQHAACPGGSGGQVPLSDQLNVGA